MQNWTIGGNKLAESNVSDGDFYITDTQWSNSLTVTCKHSDTTTFTETITVNTSDIVNALSSTITIPDPPAGDLSLKVKDIDGNDQTLNADNDNTDFGLFKFNQLDNTADNRMTVSKENMLTQYSGHFNIPMTPYTTIYQVNDANGALISSSRLQRSPENILVRINNLPQATYNTGISVQESVTTIISNVNLQYTDNANTTLTYTLTSVPLSGTLKLSDTSLNVSDTFTQSDIDANNLKYLSSDSGGAFSFGFNLSDGTMANPISSSFSISINNKPDLHTLTALPVNENSHGTLSVNFLKFTDDSDPDNIIYTITQKPDPNKGTLRKSSVIVDNNDTFTQYDINRNVIDYYAVGDQNNVAGSMNDLFKFTVNDSSGSALSSEQTMTIIRNSSNDMPTKASGLVDIDVVENTPTVILNTQINAVDPDNVATSDDFVWQFVSTTVGF